VFFAKLQMLHFSEQQQEEKWVSNSRIFEYIKINRRH
jgi:hypothetical protein